MPTRLQIIVTAVREAYPDVDEETRRRLGTQFTEIMDRINSNDKWDTSRARITIQGIFRTPLSAQLRELRESRGLTSESVAAQAMWSLSKMIRMEGGKVSVSYADLMLLIHIYKVDQKLGRQLIAQLKQQG